MAGVVAGPDDWPGGKRNAVEEAVARLDALLRTVERVPSADLPLIVVEEDMIAAAARAMEEERERSRLFGADLFANPGWLILLHLLLSGARGRKVAASDVSAATGIAEAVALRHVAVLVAAKLVRRQPHEREPGAIYLMLTSRATRLLRSYFTREPKDRDAAAA